MLGQLCQCRLNFPHLCRSKSPQAPAVFTGVGCCGWGSLSWTAAPTARLFIGERVGIPGLEAFGHEGCALAQAITGALDLHDLDMVVQAIEQGCSDDLVTEDVAHSPKPRLEVRIMALRS